MKHNNPTSIINEFQTYSVQQQEHLERIPQDQMLQIRTLEKQFQILKKEFYQFSKQLHNSIY